jgi:hypothetical protein
VVGIAGGYGKNYLIYEKPLAAVRRSSHFFGKTGNLARWRSASRKTSFAVAERFLCDDSSQPAAIS